MLSFFNNFNINSDLKNLNLKKACSYAPGGGEDISRLTNKPIRQIEPLIGYNHITKKNNFIVFDFSCLLGHTY